MAGDAAGNDSDEFPGRDGGRPSGSDERDAFGESDERDEFDDRSPSPIDLSGGSGSDRASSDDGADHGDGDDDDESDDGLNLEPTSTVIEAGDPSLENALFVALGALATVGIFLWLLSDLAI
ncbi:hypothetical protein ACFQGT_05790 [Natrialbaceae archaeon GCM10025810]|uniref:DUF7312 domain-containing protein n=1 Tax=Halovalidus salilacus TaxID=3075124 RepID=UPI00360F08E9